MRSQPRRRILARLASSAILAAVVACASTGGPGSSTPTTPYHDAIPPELIQRARALGRVRVLVRFLSDTERSSGGTGGDPIVDPIEVRDTQDSFLNEIRRHQDPLVTRFPTLSFVALEVDENELVTLQRAIQRELALPPQQRVLPDFQMEEARLLQGQAVARRLDIPISSALAYVQAQNPALTGAGRRIVVIDNGVDADAKYGLDGMLDAGSRIQLGYLICHPSTIGNSDPVLARSDVFPANDLSHGTIVARIAHAVAPAAKLVAIRVDENGAVPVDNVIAALEEVKCRWSQSGEPIAAVCVSLSWSVSMGGSAHSAPCDPGPGAPPRVVAMARIIAELEQLGVAVVVAAGNDQLVGSLTYPACVGRAVNAASTCIDLWAMPALHYSQLSAFSNWSNDVDLVAPGADVALNVSWSAWLYSVNGTSIAAPFVAGAFAALSGAQPQCTQAQIFAALRGTGLSISSNGISQPLIQIESARHDLQTTCPSELPP